MARFWFCVDGSKHSFVEADRIPSEKDTVIYRVEQTGLMTKGTVVRVETEIMTGKSDIGNPVHVIYHVYATPQDK